MEDFLPMLRMTNTFPVNRAKDRPFGMPNIDNGSLSELLREVSPVAQRMKELDARYRGGMRNSQVPQASQAPQAPIARALPRKSMLPVNDSRLLPAVPGGVAGGGGAANSGFSPMQKMWQAEKIQNTENNFRRSQLDTELSGRYKQAMDTENLQQTGAMGRTQAEVAGRMDEQRLQGAQAQALERDKAAVAAIQEKIKHGYKLTEDERRIFHETRGRIMEERAKPPAASTVLTPKEQGEQMDTNLRRFRLLYPDIAKAFTQVEGQPLQVDWSRLDPTQTRFAREFLTGEPQPGVAPGQEVSPSATRRKGAPPLRRPALPPPSRPPVSQPGMSNRPPGVK